MRLAIYILIFLSSLAATAQSLHENSWQHFSSDRAFVGTDAYVSGASNSITNSFAWNFLRQPWLTNELRNNQSAKLTTGTTNRSGVDYSSSVTAGLNLASREHGVFLHVADRFNAESIITKEAFDLTTRGNKPFAGDTLNLGYNMLRSIRYQQIGIGWTYSAKADSRYSVMVSYINGQSLNFGYLNNASLYTSSIGDTLAVAAAAYANVSDTSNRTFAASNAWGLALDLFMSQEIDGMNNCWKVNVSMTDIGFTQWTNKTATYLVDTSIVFGGLEIANLDAFLNLDSTDIVSDSVSQFMDQIHYTNQVGHRLPGRLQINLTQQVAKGFYAGGGVAFRLFSIYRPYGWLTGGLAFSESFKTQLELGYGGYGNLQVAAMAMFQTDHLRAFAKIGNLEALTVPQHFGGATAQIGIQYAFGS